MLRERLDLIKRGGAFDKEKDRKPFTRLVLYILERI
jgi:hypothetical protein